MLTQVQAALRNVAHVQLARDFLSARSLLFEACPRAVVTNLRLGAYNGIQLALMAALNQTRCIVYEHGLDVMLARQAQLAGAFYARGAHVSSVIRSFVISPLPEKDRRNPAMPDRRASGRPGRRSTDSTTHRVTLDGVWIARRS
jgi:hypothetical protein